MLEQMNALARVALGERSEARAYSALLAPSTTAFAHSIGTAVALVAPKESRSTLLNRVIGLGLDGPVTTSDLESIAQLYGPTRNPWCIELALPCSSPEVLALLKQYGYRRSGPQVAIFAVECAQFAELPRASDIHRSDALSFRSGAELQAEVFGVSPLVCDLLIRAADSGQFHQLMAFEGDQPAAACLSFIAAETAWGGWSATLPAYRGKGLQKALLVARARDAAQAGCRWITSETAIGTAEVPDRSHQNHLKLGFVELYQRQSYLHLPAHR